MRRTRFTGTTGGIVGGVIGLLAGGTLGSLIALAGIALVMPMPEPEPSHGPDPIASIRVLSEAAVRLCWVIGGGGIGGIVGAIGGATFGATRGRRSGPIAVDAAPRGSTPAEEIAELKARIAELERDRDAG